MSKILLGVIGVMTIIGLFLWNENSRLSELNKAYEIRDQEQKAAIESLQNDFALQTQSLQEMTLKSQAAQRELNRYTQFIQNYQLTAKILENPVEMQRKINNGTKHIMEDIEKLSDTIDNLDDGLQLQPNSN